MIDLDTLYRMSLQACLFVGFVCLYHTIYDSPAVSTDSRVPLFRQSRPLGGVFWYSVCPAKERMSRLSVTSKCTSFRKSHDGKL